MIATQADAHTAAAVVTAPPGPPTMSSHAGSVLDDTSATAAFYSGVLGMKLVATMLDDRIPSTGEPVSYPHIDSTWPDTLQVAANLLDGLSDEVVRMICRGDAIELFALDFVA
jgi:hypothetical protein